MTFASVAALRDSLTTLHSPEPPAWRAKMLQPVPDLPYVAKRREYLVEKVTGEVVLDLGCTGKTAEKLRAAAKGYYGVDKTPGPWHVTDLDAAEWTLPDTEGVTVIVMAELLEHLANPGFVLRGLRTAYPGIPLWITVPQAGAYRLRNGTHEEVNPDHVCWYSYTTLKTLLGRYGYQITLARWYGGRPSLPEGLIVQAV